MHEISKIRHFDEEGEIIAKKFLQQKFYNLTDNYIEVNDKIKQFKGIDAEFDMNGFHYIVDEKAAIKYVNKPLNTFCFELSFIDRGMALHQGWFIDDNKENNAFILLYIDKGTVNTITDINQIIKSEILLIKKENIFNYLKSLKWTKDKLISKSNKIRTNDNENLGNITKNNIKFSFSKQLPEKPINILIQRNELRNIADCCMI